MQAKNIRLLTRSADHKELNQAEFSEKYHIPYDTYKKWENGTNPPEYVLELLYFRVKHDMGYIK